MSSSSSILSDASHVLAGSYVPQRTAVRPPSVAASVVVPSMNRLARNLEDLRRLVRDLTGRGVTVRFIKEGLTFTGDDSQMATLLLSVMDAFAEFERSLIRERQAEGIALAKQRGVYKGRPRSLPPAVVATLRQRVAAGEAKTRIAHDLGI